MPSNTFSFNFQSFALYHLIVQKILFHVICYMASINKVAAGGCNQ